MPYQSVTTSICHWQAVILALLLAIAGISWSAEENKAHGNDEKLIMGWLETIYLQPGNLKVTAKLDTGAKTSSVHASKIEHFVKSGDPWVRFLFSPDKDSETVKIERPLIRTAIIKERLAGSSKRDVVALTFCKNGKNYETEFTLNDRSNFNYPVLLGRSFLAGIALVDSSSTFNLKGEKDICLGKSKAQEN